MENSLAVQWLGFQLRAQVQFLVQELRSHRLCSVALTAPFMPPKREK